MKRAYQVLSALLCIVVVAGCSGNSGSREPAKASLSGGVKMWVPFNEGMARASKEKKHVVIDFYTSWCRWCKVMDKETFSDPAVKKFLADNFVTIRIDAEDRKETLSYRGEEYSPFSLARKFGVSGFPSLAYLDREGNLVTVVPGFVPAKTFLPLLQYMEKECYKQQMTFQEFMKRNGECDSTKAK
jgi:thioredoxin-related protein